MPTTVETVKRSCAAQWRLFRAFLWRALESVAVVTVLTVAGAMITISTSRKGKFEPMPEIKNDPVLFIAGIFGLLVIGWQTWMNYRKSTFDVTLALNYRKILFDDKKPERYAASVAALEALNVPKDQREKVDILEMEPVLDEFEDIGFLLHNGQISDEVVFHYFSHWVQMEIPQWVDSPGTYHGGGCGFAFADAIQNPIIGPVRRPKLGSNAQLWRIQMTCETGIGCGYGLPPIFRALCRHPDKTVRTKTLRFLAISDTAI